jgi:arylsulfatase A-like enzyme
MSTPEQPIEHKPEQLREDLPGHPNILLITCDQYRFPRFSYGADAGFAEPLKQILGFQGEIGADNPYAAYFPGLLRLRGNAVVLRNHTIAASACTPSRASIYTGQYGTRTGVTQTDRLFKSGDSPNFPWLAPDSIPTLGSWLREAGYATHYFGKWHVGDPPGHSLERFGFDNWEESWPEPHGAQINNLGVYRDAGFTDSVCAFLRRQGLALNYNRAVATASADDPDGPAPDANAVRPWFAVASFVNPHDIATYPAVLGPALPAPPDAPPIVLPDGVTLPPRGTQSVFGPLTVPQAGQESPPPTAGSLRIELNPLGFPQDCASAAPTQGCTFDGKPSCQFDYAYKMGLALAAKTGFAIAAAVGNGDSDFGVKMSLNSDIPFTLAKDPTQSCLDFIQLYGWLHAVVDTHIDAVLRALDESGQGANTIVVFLTDHGEYAAAHGMLMEKWHTAYQEALHVPVVVQFPEAEADAGLRQIDALTSHIDILPTILGLARIPPHRREKIATKLAQRWSVPPLPGVDLAPLLRGETDSVTEPDGEPRQGVLFITDDEITAPLPPSYNAHGRQSLEQFALFEKTVASVIAGTNGKGPVPALAPGSVRQPNHIRCVRTIEYKLARYFDPSGKVDQEWEMYDLVNDPNEVTNLVQVSVTPPTSIPSPPGWTDPATVQSAADELARLLAALELRNL